MNPLEIYPLVEKLRARYPGVGIVDARMSTRADGETQQMLRFQAPLELLKRYGLVTARMVREREQYKPTPIGDGFLLTKHLDSGSCPGSWDFLLLTEASPREYRKLGTQLAKTLLRRIAKIKERA